MKCAGCGLLRDAADLLAYWPVKEPGLRRYVCRPTRPSPAPGADGCFRLVVASRLVHTIGAVA